MRGSICNVTPAIILSPHCTLRYDAAVELRTFYASCNEGCVL